MKEIAQILAEELGQKQLYVDNVIALFKHVRRQTFTKRGEFKKVDFND